MPSTHESADEPRRITHVTVESYNGDTNYSSYVTNEGRSRVHSVDKSWVTTPGYWSIAKNGGSLPDNPFSYQRWDSSGGQGVLRKTFLDAGWYGPISTLREAEYSGRGWAIVNVDNTFSSSLGDRAKAKAIARAKGQKWSAPVFFAELGKTATMVDGSARRLVLMASALRRGDVRTFSELMLASSSKLSRNGLKGHQVKAFRRDFGKDASRAAANYWLEWSYGWSPFVKDVYDAFNAFAEIAERPENQVFTVQAQVADRSYTSSDTVVASDTTIGRVYGILESSTKESARITWRGRPTAGSVPILLGLTNPAEVIWNLFPYSFVADWFIPIGDYLSSLDGSFAFDTTSVVLGQRKLVNTRLYPTRADPGVSFSGFDSVCTFVNVVRTPLAGGIVPSSGMLTAKLPSSVERAVSAISLLRQRFR